MSLKEKFEELINKRNEDFSDESVLALEKFISNNTIRFNKYFDNPNGQNPKASHFNMTGTFVEFETNSNFHNCELMKITYQTGETFYVQTSDIFFDEK